MAFTNPTVNDFKSYFARDMSFGTDPNTSVLDSDIAKAMTFTNVQINQAFYGDQTSYNNGYFLLTAHFLVLNLRQASQGINGQFNFLENSKTVGSVSSAFSIPQRILDNPFFAMLCKTNYGAEYLFTLLPQLSGQMYTVVGSTRP